MYDGRQPISCAVLKTQREHGTCAVCTVPYLSSQLWLELGNCEIVTSHSALCWHGAAAGLLLFHASRVPNDSHFHMHSRSGQLLVR